MKTRRRRILMPVFGEIDYDGRVQRAAEALGEVYEVTVLSIDSGNEYTSAKFDSRVVTVPNFLRVGLPHLRSQSVGTRYLSGSRARCLHAVLLLHFWLELIFVAVRVRPTFVYAHDFFVVFPCWVVAFLTRAMLIYDAHELIVPEQDPDGNDLNWIWYRLEKWVVRKANLVIAANGERATIMQAHYGLNKLPLVIRNIPPMPTQEWGEQEILRHYPQLKRDNSDTVRLVYIGNINIKRRVDKFIAAMKYLPDNFELVMVGTGVDLENLRQQAKMGAVAGKVKFLGMAPESHLHYILGVCDIGVIAYSQFGMNNIYCASNKLFEYLQAGLPVISTRQRSLQPIIDGFRVGELVGCDQAREEDSAQEIAAAIRRIAGDLSAYKARIPEFVLKNTWEAEHILLTQAIDNL